MAEVKELVENNLISLHTADIARLHEGNLPLNEYKAAFSRLIENKEPVKAELSKLKKEDLLKKLGGFSDARYKNEKKDRIVSVVWGRLLDDFVYDSVSYTHGEKYEDVIGKIVNNADQAYLDAYAAEVVSQRAARAERMAKLKKSFENPETIDEFRTLIDYKGKDAISKLSAEKQELYDELVSGKTKEQRAKEAAQRAIVQSVELGDTEMTLIETKHTQKGHDIFVVKLGNRIEKETYNDLNIKAKRLGGYYSSYSKGGAVAGFQFKEKSQAEKFMSLKEDDVDNLDKVTERAEDKKQKTAEKLAELGENTVERAEEVLNADRKTNTARRAIMATGIEEDALKDKQLGETLQNLAAAIASGDATHLDTVKTKTHVELLDSLISRAKSNELRTKYPEYRDYLNHKGEELTTETVAFLEQGVFPKIYKDNLQRLISEVKNKSGMKLVSARWQKRIAAADPKMDYIIPHSDKEMMELADMVYSAGLKNYDTIKSQVDTYKRLKAMGLENDSMLRSALREYVKFRGGLGQIEASKLLERATVGKKLGIDFFPTPSPVAMEMVQKADLEKGMDTLEPSAGNGNIAEMMRVAGVEPDVIEISDELRKILEAKRFNLIGYDFLNTDFTGRRYDRIVMNPPFSNSQDIKHVSFAYELLKPGGRIVAIMGEGAFIRSDRQATEFQIWLGEMDGFNEPLPQNTFRDTNLMSTTRANARLVVIDKPIDKTNETPRQMESINNLIDLSKRTFKLNLYRVNISAPDWDEEKYYGSDEDEAKSIFNSLGITDLETRYHNSIGISAILEKEIIEYKFIYELDDETESIDDFPLEQNYKSSDIYEEVDVSDWETVETKDLHPINKKTDEILTDVQSHYDGKYSIIYLDKDETVSLKLRIADHSGKWKNKGTEDYFLSIVIAEKNATKYFKTAGPEGLSSEEEFEFDNDHTAEQIITFIDEKINELKAKVKEKSDNKIYIKIKSCLLADGDNENDFIIEGSKITNTEGGTSTIWEIIGFLANGMELKHVAYSALTDNKGNQFLSFADLKHAFDQNYLTISGINQGDTRVLNLCIKSIKKCMEQIDQLEYHKFVTQQMDENHYGLMPESVAEELAKYWGIRKMAWNKKEITLTKDELSELKSVQINIDKHFPQFNHYLTNEPIYHQNIEKDGIKLTRTIQVDGKTNIRMEKDGFIFGIIYPTIIYPDPVSNDQAIGIYKEKAAEESQPSNFTEIESQIELLKETLLLLKGKTKKEVKENIDLLNESLELLKAA